MFSPMSSGRDKWEEGSSESGSNSKSGNAGASGSSAAPKGGVGGSSRPIGGILAGKSKGKGRQRENLIAPGRISSPAAPDKLSLGFDFRKIGKGLGGGGGGAGVGQGGGARGQRRDRYAASSIDEDIDERQRLLSSPTPSSTSVPHKATRSRRRGKAPRWKDAFRPNKKTVDRWMESWTARWTVLAIIPSVFVWVWCAMPFPGSKKTGGHSHADGQFIFFLIWYYGVYSAVGLIYITQLFSLYRLNWWPAALGARKSYISFWLLSIVAGYVLHSMAWDRLPSMGRGWLFFLNIFRQNVIDDDEEVQWQRKTPWVGLALATMAMPALVCFAGLRRGGRQTYRHSLTDTQKTFLENDLNKRIPASYIRFLWFMAVIGVALVALLAGQGYASVYLSTLPHTGLDGTAYVAFWTINVNVLLLVSHWILEEKVRSRALLFVIKYYYFLVYFIFYRNLFARLRSFDQFALIQLLSSFWVCIWYPFSMTRWCHDLIKYFTQSDKSYEEYVESVGLAFYLRNLAQNTTMLAFLGWVSILHFGPNKNMYPFFSFADKHDPYNYQLTFFGSLAIWASELASSFVARQICLLALDVDVTNLGLDEMRSYPELVTSVMWTSIHVLMDMLLFLIKLDFN